VPRVPTPPEERRAYPPGARDMVEISIPVVVRLDGLLSRENRISLE
jgi:hypothetical protein